MLADGVAKLQQAQTFNKLKILQKFSQLHQAHPSNSQISVMNFRIYHEGDTAQINCQAGFTVNAVQSKNSQNVTCGNGIFPLTTCAKTPCNPPVEIANGYWYHESKNSGFVEDDVVTYRCNRCFRMVATHQTFHRQHKPQQCTGGVFPSPPIICKPLFCGNAPFLQNARVEQKAATVEY